MIHSVQNGGCVICGEFCIQSIVSLCCYSQVFYFFPQLSMYPLSNSLSHLSWICTSCTEFSWSSKQDYMTLTKCSLGKSNCCWSCREDTYEYTFLKQISNNLNAPRFLHDKDRLATSGDEVPVPTERRQHRAQTLSSNIPLYLNRNVNYRGLNSLVMIFKQDP